MNVLAAALLTVIKRLKRVCTWNQGMASNIRDMLVLEHMMKSLHKIGICTGTQEEGPLKYERQVYRKGTSRHLPVPHALQCICGNFCYLWTWKLTDWLLNGSCIDIIPLANSCIYRFQHVIKRLARVGVSFSLRRQRPWQQRWRSCTTTMLPKTPLRTLPHAVRAIRATELDQSSTSWRPLAFARRSLFHDSRN